MIDVGGLLGVLAGQNKDIVGWLKKIAKPVMLLATPLLAGITALIGGIKFAMGLLSRVLAWIDAEVATLDLNVGNHQLNSVATDFWVALNTFIPVDLIFSLGMVLLALRAVMAVVRIIKSWIPTVN